MSLLLTRPSTTEEALSDLVDHPSARILAGGQSLVLAMNTGRVRPEALIYIGGVRDLRRVELRDGRMLEIGALCTHAELGADPVLSCEVPALAGVFPRIGNARVRTAGTLGGNLVEADPCQDPAVLLCLLDAEVRLRSPDGERSIPVPELATGPGTTRLEDAEILTHIRIPLPEPGHRFHYRKFRPGTTDDYATVSIGVCLTADANGRIAEAKLAAGSVGPRVVLLRDAADELVGTAFDADVQRRFEDLVRAAVTPTTDRRGSAEYKREMAVVEASRAVRACLAGVWQASGDGR